MQPIGSSGCLSHFFEKFCMFFPFFLKILEKNVPFFFVFLISITLATKFIHVGNFFFFKFSPKFFLLGRFGFGLLRNKHICPALTKSLALAKILGFLFFWNL